MASNLNPLRKRSANAIKVQIGAMFDFAGHRVSVGLFTSATMMQKTVTEKI